VEVNLLTDYPKKGTMSVQEAGRLGGQKGGRRTAETHGREFYEAIGHKGGQKVRMLIKEGKAQETR
jgi:general stress protein YciG